MPLPCRLTGCPTPAIASWTRRPTDDELAGLGAAEQSRRGDRLLLADPDLPPPDFGPLPTADTTVVPVYACGPHAIDIELACRVHQATCTAPNPDHLPGCDCDPEAPPGEDRAKHLRAARAPALEDS